MVKPFYALRDAQRIAIICLAAMLKDGAEIIRGSFDDQ
jgi:hypothetical protein